MAKSQSRILNPSFGNTVIGHVGKPAWVTQVIADGSFLHPRQRKENME